MGEGLVRGPRLDVTNQTYAPHEPLLTFNLTTCILRALLLRGLVTLKAIAVHRC